MILYLTGELEFLQSSMEMNEVLPITWVMPTTFYALRMARFSDIDLHV